MSGMDQEEQEETTPLAAALSRIGDRWSLLVVNALLGGPRRFGELQSELSGIASNVLSQRLRRLEEVGVVVSRPYSSRPPRHAYELSASGQELAGALRLLSQWGADHLDGVGGVGEGPTHASCGTALEARWYCPTCDRTVDDAEGDDLHYL
ncbi:MAG TPA: helix-turn-helix domain-containing protein [Acidimicrobiales bacterium]|nr:helix-turn-helix domain-containing protein [Acidimicrobiales bacterium]